MDDHYFGTLKPRVSAFMHELDEELWKLGIPSKTKHNEVAPAQHEMAPIFENVNIATDHNQLTMEIMRKIADKHNLVCLLHEKPFAGINGSGKHNNWSISTNDGVNLLKPGRTPAQNIQFLVFLMAVIKAVDDYADLMRVSAASAGNDHRLGANEAPPAIVSIFLGDELNAVLKSIENDTYFGKQEKVEMNIGANVLPHFFRDTTDRNRTSPFAFTGNKFEFRMVGSAASVSGPNVILNTAVAESLAQFYIELEGTKEEDMEHAVHELIKRAIRKHKKVIFDGNGYTDEWIQEAEARGLYNLPTTPDCMPYFISEKNISLFTKHHIYTKEEILSRYEIQLETYVKTIKIEAKAMIDMISKDLLPAVNSFAATTAREASETKAYLPNISCTAQDALIRRLTSDYTDMTNLIDKLKHELTQLGGISSMQGAADYCRDRIIVTMNEIRTIADDAEAAIPNGFLPYPTYEELLFYL